MSAKKTEIKKSTKKTTKKSVKPEYIVDFTNIKDAGDAFAAMGWAKIDKYLTRPEFDAVLEDITESLAPRVVLCDCAKCSNCEKSEKKPNVFKRFWNWITRKK